jgi:hypothetical protein
MPTGSVNNWWRRTAMEGNGSKSASRRALARGFSPATVISIVALFIALSGTAYAATGGTFILGKANSASAVSSLTNTAGTALRLSSAAGTPPLSVNSSVQVPKLNASLLGGNPASSFVQGGGRVSSAVSTLNNQSTGFLVGTYPDEAFYLDASCDPGGLGTGAEILLYNSSTQSASGSALSTNGNPSFVLAGGSGASVLSGDQGMVTLQVVSGARIMTFTATVFFNPGFPDVCTFTGQVLSNT